MENNNFENENMNCVEPQNHELPMPVEVEKEVEETPQVIPKADVSVEAEKCSNELFLVVKNRSGNEEVKHNLIEGEEITIGSGSECDVLVFDEYISTKHFAVKLENGEIKVRDLNSTNGLYLKVDNPLEVRKDQSLLAGVSLFLFEEKTSE